MTQPNGAAGPPQPASPQLSPPAPRAGNVYDDAVIAAARKLVEETTLTQTAIAAEIGVAPPTVGWWKRRAGWVRPPGAPTGPNPVPREVRSARRARLMLDRLYRVFGRGLTALETRVGRDEDGLEKDARALASLAKTLETLKALDRDDGAKHPDSDGVDPDEIRARLARKLFAMGQGGA
jgi:hypothetical protein